MQFHDFMMTSSLHFFFLIGQFRADFRESITKDKRLFIQEGYIVVGNVKMCPFTRMTLHYPLDKVYTKFRSVSTNEN